MAITKKSNPLTRKQQEILNFIKKKVEGSGYPPTVREIGDQFQISVHGAHDHLLALSRKGYIQNQPNKSRSIRIIEHETTKIPVAGIPIPLLGRVAAGTPVEAHEDIEAYLTLPRADFADGEFFALRIKGDSMIDCGIFEGDIVIIRRQPTADNGDIVVALLDEEATLKRFKRTGKKIHLIPENQAYKPIIVDQVIILGKLAAVYRRY